MITDLNKILVEWAYRTSDGKPDVKNSAKLLTLETVLKDFGWSREAIPISNVKKSIIARFFESIFG